MPTNPENSTSARPVGVNPAWRTLAISLAIVVVLLAAASVRRRQRPSFSVPATPDPVGCVIPTPAADELLGRAVDAVDFDHLPLGKALDWFTDRGHLNLDRRWDEMSSVDVTPVTPVTVHLRAVTIGQALEITLATAGARSPLDWVDDDGLVTVSTQQALAASHPVVRMYDVRPLVDLAAVRADAFGPYVRPPPGLSFGATPPVSLEADRVTAIEQFVQDTVDPASWRDNGGDIGRMSYLDGRLTVWQSTNNHAKVARVLSLLLNGRPPPTTGTAGS